MPRDAFGWGALTVIAAFVLLAAGARRSLEGELRGRGGDPGPSARDGRSGNEAVTGDVA